MNFEVIEQEVKKTTDRFIGEPANRDTVNEIKTRLTDSITSLSGSNANLVKCGLAWNVMSFKDKLLWWVSTVAFPSIRKELVRFMPDGSPIWLLKDPKVTIVADIKFSSPLPLQSVSVSVNIQEKCWENAAEWSKEDFAESDKAFVERLKTVGLSET